MMNNINKQILSCMVCSSGFFSGSIYAQALSTHADAIYTASPIDDISSGVYSNETLGTRLTERLVDPVGVDKIKCEEYADDINDRYIVNEAQLDEEDEEDKRKEYDCENEEDYFPSKAYRSLRDPGLNGYVSAGYQYTENIGRLDDDEVEDDLDDVGLDLRAGLGYQDRVGDLSYRIGGDINGTYYDDYGNLDNESYRINAGAVYTINKDVSVGINGGRAESEIPRNTRGSRVLETFDDDLDKSELNIIGAQINLGSNEDKFQLILAGSLSSLEYDIPQSAEDEGFVDLRDRDYDNISASLIYNYSPRTRYFIDWNHTDISYEDNIEQVPDLDSDQTAVHIGFLTELTNRTSLQGRVGYLNKSFDSNTYDDVDTTDYNVSLSHRLTEKLSLSFYSGQTVDETSQIGSSSIESRLYGTSFNYRITQRLNLGGYYNNIDDDYQDSFRRDDIDDYGLRLNYNLTKDILLGLNAGRNERDSSGDGIDYESYFYGININYSFGN